MSGILKFVIGFIGFLIYSMFMFYGCGIVDDCVASKQSKIQESLASKPELSNILVDVDSCGKVKMSGVVDSQEKKDSAIAACVGCGFGLDASGVKVLASKATPPTQDLSCLLKASLDKENGKITLSGSVPNGETQQNIVSAASQVYGDTNVSHKFKHCSINQDDKLVFSKAATAAMPLLKEFSGDAGFEMNAKNIQFWGTVSSQVHADRLDKIKNIDVDYEVSYEQWVPVQVAELDQNTCQEEINQLLSKNKIQFKTASSDISPDSDALLIELETTLEKCDQLNVVIEGHTDTRGNESKNQILSEKRANSVVQRLYDLGLSRGRATAIGMGEASPIADESTPEGLATNRRIEFKLQGEQ